MMMTSTLASCQKWQPAPLPFRFHQRKIPLELVVLQLALISGIATGISNLTHEAYIYDGQGQLITSNLKDYAMLTAGEMPQEYVIGHHDTPSEVTVYGHKRMITEGVPAGVAPAIANAIIDAFDGEVDLRVIPVFPGDVWGHTSGASAAREAQR